MINLGSTLFAHLQNQYSTSFYIRHAVFSQGSAIAISNTKQTFLYCQYLDDSICFQGDWQFPLPLQLKPVCNESALFLGNSRIENLNKQA